LPDRPDRLHWTSAIVIITTVRVIVSGIVRVHISHVLFQVEITTESFGTRATLIRLTVRVSVHVKFQVVDLVEGLGAYGALVLFTARMG